MTEFDHLIVGAGAAGSVLANRLSEDPRPSVLLLEAGRDVVSGQEPADVRNVFPLSSFNTRYMWSHTRVHWQRVSQGRESPYPAGRIVGGSLAIMGMWAVRDMPHDYDEWQAAGASGWGWSDVLPLLRKLESDIDFDGLLHGSDGPVPIRREAQETWSPISKAVASARESRGWDRVDDMNADFGDGICTLPMSRHEGSRGSAGLVYLTAQVRARPNLRVVTDCAVGRLTFDGTRVTGVMSRRADGSTESFKARQTLVAGGALRTPVLLMRSGIGAGADLRHVPDGARRRPRRRRHSKGRVHGVRGLRCVDASVMPTVPSGNTHIAVVMVAEKLADAMRRE